MIRQIAITALAVSALASGQSPDAARSLFQTQCAVCHGDGHGTERGPNLVKSRKMRGWSASDTRALIRQGVPAAGMPAFALADAQLDLLAGLVRSWNASAAEAAAPGEASAGEAYFFGKGGCSGCHMANGRGLTVGPDLSTIGRDVTLEDLARAVREPSAQIKPGYQIVTAILAGDKGAVRGFARNRSQFNLQLVDLNGTHHLLAAKELASVRDEAGSLMPAPRCTEAECRDVVKFLATLTGPRVNAAARAFGSMGTGIPFARIANPRPGDWPSYHGSLTGNRHSPLTGITPANVHRLALQWVFPIAHNVIEATPLAVDGVLYVPGPNQVFAIDGRSGRTIWHYQRPRSSETRGDPAKGTNRGVAILGDRVFLVTDNAHLLALHRLNGQLLWEANLPEGLVSPNFGNTAAPLAVGDDTIVAGISGGDLGMRGFLSAYKASTGERIWRFFTVPAPGEPGSETWKGDALARYGGGGGTWMTGTYDPETDTVFWGVGNPYPAMNGDERKGDNLYTSGVIALQAKTGALKWHYQFTPHDLYDWDGGQTPLLANRMYRGRERKLMLQANRNGFFYVFDRTNGELLLAEKFSDRVTWASGIGKDGRPILAPGMEPTRDGAKVCPNVLGAANWPSVALSPGTGWFYVQSRDACGIYTKPPSWNPKPIPLEPGRMVLRALDIETGKRAWEVPQQGPADSWGGVLSTESGVLFYGEDSGALAAVDARTGKALWHIQTNASAELGDGHSWRSSPMTYSAAGRQYVAVTAGPNVLAFALPEE